MIARGAPGKANVAGGDDDFFPVARRSEVAPDFPPDIVMVGEFELKVVASTVPPHLESDLKIAGKCEWALRRMNA
jgi:hypothetical protein